MKNRKHTRGLSLLLCAALLAGQLGTTVYAEGSSPGNREVVCEHHPEHTEACGYMEAEPGQPCQHQHTGDCYTDELICGFDDEDAPTATDSDATTVHEHTQECYALDCPHERGEHDEDCGYVETVKGHPCGFVCDECGNKELEADNGNNPPAPDLPETDLEQPEEAAVFTITDFDGLDEAVQYQTISPGTKLDMLNLPATLGASGYTVGEDTEPAPIIIEGVTWKPDTGYDDTAEQGGYTFTPILPAGYTCAGDVALPEIYVRIGEANVTLANDIKAYNTNDLAAFQAILDEHTSLVSGDVKRDDPASWTGLVTWDESNPKRIIKLYLPDKSLTGELDVSGLTKLTYLNCANNDLETLDGLGSLTKLTGLDCTENKLTALDVTGTALTSLNCNNNNLETLSGLGSLTKLTNLNCTENKLTALDVTGTALTNLNCANNNLETLDGLGSLTKLTNLLCYNNNLETLDGLGSLTKLTTLRCYENQLTALDLSSLTNLKHLSCSNNQLTALDLSGLSSLAWLFCVNNPYTSFKTKDNKTLTVNQTVGGTVWTTDFDFSSNNIGLEATPDTGYSFKEWTTLPDDATPNGNTASFTLDNRVTVQAAFIKVAALSDLSLSAGTLTPDFDPAITDYTASVGYDTSSVTISATPAYSGKVSGDTDEKTLDVGPNKCKITVTSEDKNATKEYTVTITRAEAATIPVAGVTLDKMAYTLYTNKDPQTFKLQPTVEPGNATDKTVSWKSSNTGVAKVDVDGNVTAVSTGTATITVTTKNGNKEANCVVTVETYSSGGGGGDNDNSSSSYVTITTPKPPQPDSPVLAVVETPVTVGNGTATGTANDGDTSEAITKALNTAKQKGREKYGIAIQYDAATATAYNGFSITLKRATLDRLLDPNNNLKYLTLNTSVVDMTFGLAELTEIARQTSGDVTFTAARVTGLTGDALYAIGTRPAYDLKISYQKDGQTVYLSSVGSVSVGIAYTPAETEQAGGLYLVYADGKGGAEWLYRSSYDKGSGNVIGSINHFSIYGVGYRPAPIFTDTVNHWAKSDIDFVASRNLLTGTGDATFSPDSTITRGMFVTALGRLSGIDPAAYPSSSRFSDVPATAYYAPFVEWAASKEIVNGTGAASFEPDRPVTREEMAVIMQRYAGKLGYTLPKEREAEIFTDNATITSDMKDAVQAMQQAGVMNGKGGRLFAPKDTATRAEAAAVLRRFVEIVIDRDTAGGWAQNDTGSWLYYENHRPVTGWKQVEGTWYYFDAAGLMQSGGWRQIGGKWYYFYADGSMAANTEIDGYQIGPDGARNF